MEAYLGEIRLFAFGTAPRFWMPCAGQLLNINVNQALFSLLSTQYGGDGITNFRLPDLRGRVAIHRQSGTYEQGKAGGEETVTLTTNQMPSHSHSFQASANNAATAIAGNGKNRLFAKSVTVTESQTQDGAALYGAPTQETLIAESTEACAASSDGVGHNNMQPSLVMSYMICVNGIFPPRN